MREASDVNSQRQTVRLLDAAGQSAQRGEHITFNMSTFLHDVLIVGGV